jgi:type I restriction enzyme R subunit
MKEHANVDAILELLKELCKEYDSEINKPLEFNDPQLQSFFEILKSDNYFTKKYNDNSETLRNIAIDINNAIQKDGNINDQFLVNNKVKTSVVVALKKMLKNKYNYPPDELEISARRFVDSITEEIKIRPAKI